MSSTTNIPINTRSMNGIITISDGVATMENGNLTDVNSLDASNINSTVLTTTTQPLHSNNNDVATTAFVHNELIDYALLNPITQTFTGNNNFITQAIGNNSTLVATTAFIKNQNYITAASLAGYALLDPPTTQLWGNVTTPQDNWWYGNTFSYDTIESVNGFTVKSSPNIGATTYAFIDSTGNISTTSTIKSIGIVSSDTAFNIPTVSPLLTINNNGTITQTSTGTNNLFNTILTGTSNQLSIKAFANIGSSTISQSAATLNISAVTNNASPLTSLVLATRTSANGGCVLFNGNSSQLNIGTDTAIINMQAITTNFTGIVNFKNNVNISLYNFDITNTAGTQGMRMFNNGANNNITDIHGIGTSTRFNFYSTPSTGPEVNNLWIGNGNNAVLQGQAGKGIEMTNDSIVVQGITNFNNTTTPTITNTISLSDNTQKIATTAFVKGQGYALLNPLTTQTWGTSQNTFTGQTQFNNYNNYYYGGTFTSRIGQLGNDLIIENVSNTNGIRLKTLTTGLVTTENIVCLNGNQAYLQGSTGNTINITGQQATIGGALVPVMTVQPLLTSNTNEIASTAFVKGQSYTTVASLSSYALLNTANQTFTGTDIFSNTGTTVPLVIKSNTSGIGATTGNHFIAANNSNYNLLVSAGDYVIFAGDSSNNLANANLTLTSWSATKVGIKITQSYIDLYGDVISQNAPYNCGYLQLPVPFTTKTNYDQGFNFTVAGTSFTGQNWTIGTPTSPYNIMTIAWNGFNNYTYGVWHVDIIITTNYTTAVPIVSVLNWNTSSTTQTALVKTATTESGGGSFSGGTLLRQIAKLSFILNVTNYTTTYYLNYWLTGGSIGNAVNLTNSEISFTRIA